MPPARDLHRGFDLRRFLFNRFHRGCGFRAHDLIDVGRHRVTTSAYAVHFGQMSFGQGQDIVVVRPLLAGEGFQAVVGTHRATDGHLAYLLGPDMDDILAQAFRFLPALVGTLAHNRFGVYRHLFVVFDAEPG